MNKKKKTITILLAGLILLSSAAAIPSYAAETESEITAVKESSVSEKATPDEATTESETVTATESETSPTSSPLETATVAIESATEIEGKDTENKTKTEQEQIESNADVSGQYNSYNLKPYIRRGDANGDGTIDSTDVSVIQKFLAGDIKTKDDDTIMYGDVNGNDLIDLNDATLIQRYLNGDISYFEMISVMEDMPLYLQYNEPWGSYSYGDGTIANSGCGPTSIAMVASYLTGNEITPDIVAAFLTAEENGGQYGHYVPGVGMMHDVWNMCADHFGFTYVKRTSDISEAYEALQSGHVIISSQGTGIFTTSGHFIVLSGLWSDGTIKVNDPNDNENGKNYSEYHFTQEDISRSGTYYYVFDSCNSLVAPKTEAEFVQAFNTYFKRLGYSKAAICGMLGNIYAECSMNPTVYFADFIPDAGGASGNSNGICQWYGGNCDRFRRDCPNWNTSVAAQFKYLAETLENDGQGAVSTKYYYSGSGTKAALQSVSNTKEGAQAAAQYFMTYYERPNMKFDQSIRWRKAAEYWDMIG